MTEQEKEQMQLRIRELEKEVEKLRAEVKRDSEQKYGLRWIDVPEAFDKESENRIPILTEVKEKAVKNDDGKPTHILIEGDNYHALTCLNYTHKGKIDVIYIDPPYNTGKEFVYKDKRILETFPDGQTIDSDHPLRHSAWLSFMSKRLELAKNLLSDRGVIFISIDDNEQANLKLLCDQVFGEEKLISNIIWRKQGGGKSDSKYIANNCEYILCYKKKDIERFNGNEINEAIFNKIDENGRKYRLMSLDFGSLSYSSSLDYPITLPNGIVCYPDCETSYLERKKGVVNDHDWCWRVSLEEYERRLTEGKIEFTCNKRTGKWKVQERLYLDEKEEGGLYSNLITDYTNRIAKNQLTGIFGKAIFNYPKPLDLLEFLIHLHPNSSITILDFFAGSGTTLHATMKLNAEDGGNRQCILVQMPEATWEIKDSKKVGRKDSKIAFDEGFNTITEITYERNKRVIQGYTNAKGEKVEGLGNSLKYYKTDFVGENNCGNATDADKVELSLKAGYLLALGENTLEEISTTKSYQIFSGNKDNHTAIYFTGNLNDFPNFVEEIEKIQENKSAKIAVYIFCWGSVDIYENEFDNLRGISLKSIPQPILDIYKSINA